MADGESFFGGFSSQQAQNFQNDLAQAQTAHGIAATQDVMADTAAKNMQMMMQKTFMQKQQARLKATQQIPGAKAPNAPDTGLQSLMQGTAPDGLVDNMYEMAEDAFSAGLVEDGSKALKSATELVKSSAYIRRQNVLNQKDELIKQQKEWDMVSRIVPSINSESDWKQAQLWYQQQFGEQLPKGILNAPWSPKIKQTLLDMGLSEKDKINTSLRKLEVDSKIARDAEAIRASKWKTNLDNIEAEAERKYSAKQKGVGDYVPSAATRQQISTAEKAILQDYDKMPKTDLHILATQLVEDAKTKRERSKGALSWNEALSQTYKQMKNNGSFMTEQEKTGGATAQYPIPYKDGVKPEDGKFYQLEGKTYRYDDGGAFSRGKMVPVSAEEAASAENDADKDD